MNHYTTLGVSEDATPEEIKSAWRKLCAEHHPDRGGDTETMQQINQAYECLGDADSRSRYDAGRAAEIDALNEQAERVVANMLKKAVDDGVFNVIVIVRRQMESTIKGLEAEVAQGQQAIRTLEKKRTRVVRKSGKPNLVEQLIDQRISKVKRDLEVGANGMAVLRQALVLVDEYEDTEPKSDPATTFRTNFVPPTSAGGYGGFTGVIMSGG